MGMLGEFHPNSRSLAISGHSRSPNDSTHINSVSKKKKTEKNSYGENRRKIKSSSPDPTRASIFQIAITTHTSHVAHDDRRKIASLCRSPFSLFFFSIIPWTMASSISDPFLLASYPISKRLLNQKPSENPDANPSANIHITYTDSKSDGYATATVQGDGIHLLDVRVSCCSEITRS